MVETKSLREQIYANQQLIKKGEKAYTVNGTALRRVSNVIGSTFEGDNSMYEDSRIAGSEVDAMVRDIINGSFSRTKYPHIIPGVLLYLEKRIRRVIKAIHDSGQVLYADNIMLFDLELNVAGELDLLAISRDSVFIYDVKTGKRSFHDESYDKKYEGNGLVRSKRDQHRMQLSLYAYLFYRQYGIMPKTMAILPIKIGYEWYGDNLFVTSAIMEQGIPVKYDESVIELI